MNSPLSKWQKCIQEDSSNKAPVASEGLFRFPLGVTNSSGGGCGGGDSLDVRRFSPNIVEICYFNINLKKFRILWKIRQIDMAIFPSKLD